MKRFKCNLCGKRFHQKQHGEQHIADKHNGKGEIHAASKSLEEEPSIAERVIAAELAIACGERTDDEWLLP